MDADLFLVIGLALGVLAIPALLSAWVDGRVPRAASVMVLAAGGLIVLAVAQKPGGYALHDIPGVIAGVVGRFL